VLIFLKNKRELTHELTFIAEARNNIKCCSVLDKY